MCLQRTQAHTDCHTHAFRVCDKINSCTVEKLLLKREVSYMVNLFRW